MFFCDTSSSQSNAVDDHRSIILLAAIYSIRELIVHIHSVKLSRRHVFLG